MELASGELSGIGGKLLFMTATATSKTIRVLMDQLPERKNWEVILNNPMRENVTIVVPTPDIISSNYEEALAPFIARINRERENYLILVRGKVQNIFLFNILSRTGINKGSSIYLHLRRNIQELDQDSYPVAFYHRNTSDKRKEEILKDLQLPLGHPDKMLLVVVATVSLGRISCLSALQPVKRRIIDLRVIYL